MIVRHNLPIHDCSAYTRLFSLYTIVRPIHDCSAQSAYTRFTAWRWVGRGGTHDRHNSAPDLAKHPLPTRSCWIHPCTRLFSLSMIVRHNLPIHDLLHGGGARWHTWLSQTDTTRHQSWQSTPSLPDHTGSIPVHDCSAYTRLFGTICLYTIFPLIHTPRSAHTRF